jgi:hypothetical protein
MYRPASVLMFFLLACIHGASAAEGGVFALYSNVCFHNESGDILGTRMGVLRLGDGPYVFVQWSGGGDMMEAETYKLSPDEFKKGKLTFSVVYGQNRGTFHGTITDKAINGRFDNPTIVSLWNKPLFHLRKVNPQQKGYPVCR